MNYAGKFGSGTPDNFSSAGFKIDALEHQGGGDSVTIPDAHLLFSGDYSRSGADLIVSDQLHRVVVPGYFHGDRRPTLVSPDGAPLDPHVIEALTGHVQYAQAAGTAAAAAAKVVGHVVKMTGSASVVRNGVTITLNNGDTVLQNDVVQTGSGSSVGLVMIDGTTFNLSAGARLMLNDLTYDASSTANSSLFTLVQGAASFVAGQVAKTGDMKVGTPVATMGIRGTAVILDISAVDGKVSISVIDQRDGLTHAVQVYNSRGVLIGTVTSNGSTLTLTPIANFEVIAQESNKTVAQIQQEFSIFREALTLYEIQKAIDPNLPQHTENNTANPRQYAATGSTPATPPAPVHIPAGSTPGTTGDGTPPVPVVLNLPPVPETPGTPPVQPGPIFVTVVVPATPLPFVVTPPTVNQISGQGGDHFGPVMSADGQFIVYDPDGSIFLYNHQTHTTITVAEAGGGFSYSGQTISADGRYVVFQGTHGTQSYVYIYNNDPTDAHYQQTTQLAAGGAPAISGDGSRIVIEHGGNGIGIYDPQGHVIATITAAAIGETGSVWLPTISADGHLIAFWQTDAAAPGGSGHLFVYDLTTGIATEIASTATDAGNAGASFSADGRYVVYQGDAPGGHSEIYLYDLSTGQVVFHTANASGASYNPVISPDGNFIIFASDAELAGDGNAVTDTYVVDVSDPNNPVYRRVSNLVNGNRPDGNANLGATISAGGLYIAFASSTAPGSGDIFLADPTSGRSAIIQERASSPAILTAGGVIALTGDHNGATLSVANPSGRFTASFNAQGDIVWSFSEPKSDFAALLPGQKVTQDFVILLTNDSGTTQIPVRVVVYDADLPVTVAVANPGTIAGDNNDNTLTGTADNDILQGFGGDDTLDGLAGFDRAVYTDATGGITVDLAAGTVTGQGIGADTLIGIEAIQGSNFADHYSAAGFTGSSSLPGVPVGFNSFEGMAGDDIIAGNVNVQGQALTRISYASASAAVVVDLAAGTATGNASVGTDHFTNVSSVIGSGYDDTLRGSDNENGSFEQFDGRGGNDTIEGRGGYDFAAYNSDPATHSGITVNLAAGTVTGDASVGTDSLRGVEGVRGTHFADIYNAVGFNAGSTNAGSLGAFNNFDGQGGNDSITGNGNTRIQYSQATAAVFVDLAYTAASGTGVARDQADALGQTSLDLASVGIDVIYGGVNAVMGSMFGDSLFGSANDEHFMGLAGDDFIDGRGGYDIAQYNNMTHTTGRIIVDLALGTVTGDASTGTDTLRGIEGVQGTNFADSFDAANFGAAGYLNAAEFNVGNNGKYNQFEGMGGDDTITGNGYTRVIYFNATAGVTVDIDDGTADGDASVGHDDFSGVNGVVGSNFADVLRGSNTAPGTIEWFVGRGGNDTIDGRGGFDVADYSNDPATLTTGITVHMFAGTVDGDDQVGHDTLVAVESVIGTRLNDVYDALNFVGFNEFQGLGGDDQIVGNGATQLGYYSATSSVTVDMKLGTANGDASVGHDTFDGVEEVRGSNFGDSIYGDDDNNILDGFGGDDLIDGRGGDDELHGGSGADTFVYTTGADTVRDFNRAEGDRIDLSGVPGVHSLADLTFETEGYNTLIDFGERGTLDLRGVAELVESDFIFAPVPVNDAPDFTGQSVGISYTGNPVAVATNVSASDIDSANYAGGSLTATVTAGGHEGDTLSLAENDYIHYNASGHIVSFDSDGAAGGADFVDIGTLTDNYNSLTVGLNGNATDDAVERLAQTIQFTNANPNSAAPGTRTVTFTLDDGGGTANGGHSTDYFTATVNVPGVNHPATFDGDFTGEVTEDDTTVPSGSIHGHDVDDGTLTVQDVDAGEAYFQEVSSEELMGDYGNFTFDHTTGEWTYTLVHERVNHLAEGEVHDDTLTVASVDGTTQDIIVTVHGVNDAPAAAGDFVSANEDTATAGLGAILTANDTDAENNTLTITGVANATHGSVSLNGGTPIFTPTTNFSGQASFDYTVSDGQGGTSTATVTVDVTPVADEPAVTVDSTPQPVTNEYAVSHAGSTDNTVPAIASLGDGRFVVTYMSLVNSFDIYAEILNSDGSPATGPFLVNTNQIGDWQGYQDVVVLADGTFIVAWDDESGGQGVNIFASRFDQNGTQLDGPFNVGTQWLVDDFPMLAALPDGGFAVAWHIAGAGSPNRDIHAQFFDEHGSPTSAELDVSAVAGDEKYPDIITLEDGRVVVTWMSGVSGLQILGRIVAPDGDLGPVFQVNTGAVDFLPDVSSGREEHQYRQFSASLEDGGFVVVWTSEHTGSFDVYGQVFNADGSPQGGQITIAADPVLADLRPTVTGISDGGFVVTWHRGPHVRSGSEETDTPADDIFARRFDASGLPVGDEFHVNATEVGRQYYSVVTETSDGKLVVTWASSQDGPGGSQAGVYGRTFDLPGVGISNEGHSVTLPGFAAVLTDTDGSESLVLRLSGFPDGATFSVGASGAGADAGTWIISKPSDIASLATTPLTMTPPASYDGSFTLHVGAVVTDTATVSGGVATDQQTVTHDIAVTVVAINDAPVAGNDNVNVRPDYIAIASTLISNDSDPDEDAFAISGAAYGENEATPGDGTYTIQGQYGTMQFYATEHLSVTFGGFVDFHVNAGDFIYAIGRDADGDPLAGLPIYDLQPGQTLSEEFTYTITDSHGAISSPATVTVTFEPSLVDLRVRTADGYDTTTLWNDLHYGDITSIDETHITVVNEGRTIEIDAKGLIFDDLGDGEYSISGGLIKGFHVSGPSGAPLFDAVRYNLPAGLLDEAVDNPDSTEFDGMLAAYGYDSHGSIGLDVLRGGDLVDYFDAGGDADNIDAGKGNDVITISDNAAWNIDGGDGVDTVRLSGAFNLAAGPEGQNLTNIEIIDLNRTHANAIVVEPEDLYLVNAGHVGRILGNGSDTLVLAGEYYGHPGGQWALAQSGAFYAGDSATAGVSFDVYEYTEDELVLGTLYVEQGVTVEGGPVILSNDLQTAGSAFGAMISHLSILDGYTDDLTITAVAGDGTLAPVGSVDDFDSFNDGSDGTLSATGSLSAINQMLEDGLIYMTDIVTPPSTDMVTLTINDGQGTDSLNFIFNVTGTNPTLSSTAGNDILYATGGNDQFVFAAAGNGHDTIIAFAPGQDDINLGHEAFAASGPNDFAHWLASHATAVNGDVLIDLNVNGEHLNQDTILLKNVALASLRDSDFILPSGGGGNSL